jgi:catechol 2,3-dioxygenase-like lactoylglutathione lyase family enzyme
LSREQELLSSNEKAASQRESKTTNLFTRVDTVIVRVPDLAKARKWYEEKLGFQVSFVGKDEIVVFKTGGETSLTIYKLKPGEKKATGKTPSSYPIFYAVDAMKAHQQLKERGVKVGPIQEDETSQWFSFWDLDQNLLEVCHW